MRIISMKTELITEIPFLNAGRGPGGFYVDHLPIHEAFVDRLPDGMSAIIATGDLQGRERFKNSRGGPPRLLGEILPLQLAEEVLPELPLSDGTVGVLLAGDFYTVPALDKRGGSGDVTNVWWAFADQFDWVVGVAGNHDTFGEDPKAGPRFHSSKLHYLDHGRVNVAGLTTFIVHYFDAGDNVVLFFVREGRGQVLTFNFSLPFRGLFRNLHKHAIPVRIFTFRRDSAIWRSRPCSQPQTDT